MQNRLYVGNLAGDVASSSLQELFESHGFVMDVKLIGGDEAGRRLGFAFVTMATDESAMAAVKALNGSRLHGAEITVQVARREGSEGRGRSGGEL
jgi:RNA recognition motif-containing protein